MGVGADCVAGAKLRPLLGRSRPLMTRAILVTALAACSGCSSVEMVVRAYADPSAGSVRTFGFVPSNQTTGGELAERELRASVRTLLVAKGLAEASVGQAPDVSIQ